MEWNMFWIVSSVVLCHSSIDDRRYSLFLTLCSRIPHNGSIMWRSGYFVDYRRYLMTLWGSSNHEFIFFCSIYGCFIILEYYTLWQKYESHYKDTVIDNTEIFISSNSTIKSDDKTKRIPEHCHPNITESPPCLFVWAIQSGS